MSKITADMARAVLDYNPITGSLTWKIRDGEPQFNGRHAGKPALACPNENGHLHGGLLGEHHVAHRVIWLMKKGYWPVAIDHDDGDPANNRIGNLFERTQSENMKNRRLGNGNTSGVFGVVQIKNGRWRARIKVQGKYHALGHFGSKEDAVSARRAAEAHYGFNPNHGRS